MEIPSYVQRRTRKWNRAINFAMQPCEVPFSVYIETLRPAAGRALITLLTFGIDDVARGMFRPKGVYNNCRRGRKKRSASSVYLPEFGEEIGKRLPGAEGIKSRSFGTIEKRLWILDGISQRVFFWLMVGDIITDFVYDWATGVYREGFCKTAGRATGLWSAKGVFTSNWESGQAECTPIPSWWDNIGQWGAGAGPNYGVALPGKAIAVHILEVINDGDEAISAGWTASANDTTRPAEPAIQQVHNLVVGAHSRAEATTTLVGTFNQLHLVGNLQQERIKVQNRAFNVIPLCAWG